MATLSGATVAALTLPAVAQADPEPVPVAGAAAPRQHALQGPPPTERTSAAPAPATRQHRRRPPTPTPRRPRRRSQRTAARPPADPTPARRRRPPPEPGRVDNAAGNFSYVVPAGLGGRRRHPALLRPGAADQGDRPRPLTTGQPARSRQRHQRPARQAGPEAVRRRRTRQRQGRHPAGLRYGRVLHAVPGHPDQPAERAARLPTTCPAPPPSYEVKFTDTTKPNGQIWAGVVGNANVAPGQRSARSAQRALVRGLAGHRQQPDRHQAPPSRWPIRSGRGAHPRRPRRPRRIRTPRPHPRGSERPAARPPQPGRAPVGVPVPGRRHRSAMPPAVAPNTLTRAFSAPAEGL